MREFPAVAITALVSWVRQRARWFWHHPRRELAAYGALLLLLLVLVGLDLRGRIGFVLFLGLLALHVKHQRVCRAQAPLESTDEKEPL